MILQLDVDYPVSHQDSQRQYDTVEDLEEALESIVPQRLEFEDNIGKIKTVGDYVMYGTESSRVYLKNVVTNETLWEGAEIQAFDLSQESFVVAEEDGNIQMTSIDDIDFVQVTTQFNGVIDLVLFDESVYVIDDDYNGYHITGVDSLATGVEIGQVNGIEAYGSRGYPQLLYSTEYNNKYTAVVYNPETNKVTNPFPGMTDIFYVAWNDFGIIGCSRNNIYLSKDKKVTTIAELDAEISSIAGDNDIVAVGLTTGKIQAYNLKNNSSKTFSYGELDAYALGVTGNKIVRGVGGELVTSTFSD